MVRFHSGPPKQNADVAQLVECVPSKYEVAGSNPVIRSVGHCEQAARRIDVFHSQTQVPTQR
jgi:hypothetical protein